MKHIVTRKINGTEIPCRFATPRETGLGTDLTWKKGLLVPDKARPPHVFSSFKAATRAVSKTMKTRDALLGTLVDQHPKLQPILSGDEFFVLPLKKKPGSNPF